VATVAATGDRRLLPTGVFTASMYDPILVPTDGSEASARAAEEAFRLARAFDTTVHLLFVLDESAFSLLFSKESMGPRFERLMAEAEEYLDDLAGRAGDVPVVTATVRGMGVHRGIADYARNEGVELVVMGSRGRSGPAGVLGSTTHRVTGSTDVPVLVVSAPGPEADEE
jgi:nucleotide-binding universal stress UspA family protein